jgi:hypothetical protein
MKILFDRESSQVQVQLETKGKRLKTLFDALSKHGWRYSLSSDPLTSEELEKYQVLAIFTRKRATQPGTKNPFPKDHSFAYSEREIAAIKRFVYRGGGLLLISNHGPLSPSNPKNDWTVNDKVLARAFNIEIKPACFRIPRKRLMTMSGKWLSTDPAIASTILKGVSSIVAHNSCAISAMPGARATKIARIPHDAIDTSGNDFRPEHHCYALTLPHGSGNIIVAGNSGISGDPDTTYPGKGLIDTGDNKAFLLNSLRYVAGGNL